MLSISHAPTGALLATKLPLPLAIPLIFASHYLEDFVPHWDVGQGISKNLKSKKSAFWQELLIDFPLSIVITYLFFQSHHPWDWRIWLGWFVALLPDFLEFPYTFLGWRFWPLIPLAKFHSSVHHSIPHKFQGLYPQVVLLILIWILSH